jgi:hypothetical protein
VNISLKESSTTGDILKDFLYHQGRDKVREKLENYVTLLKKGMDIMYFFSETS